MCDKGQTQNGTFLRVKSFIVTPSFVPRGAINKMSLQLHIFTISTETSDFLDLFLTDRFGSNSHQHLHVWGVMGDKGNNRKAGTHSPWHYLILVSTHKQVSNSWIARGKICRINSLCLMNIKKMPILHVSEI